MLTLKNSSQTCNIGLLFLRQHPPLLCLEKSRLFPTVVIADIPFLTDSTSVSEDTDLFTEHFPALKGKRDLLLPNRREKFGFKFQGKVPPNPPGSILYTYLYIYIYIIKACILFCIFILLL